MKQRLLVMNGQKLVQSERNGEWVTDKVEKALSIKPGIYNIHLAMAANKSKTYDGVILHSDKNFVFQQIGKNFVKHDFATFSRSPVGGSNLHIRYEADKAIVAPTSIKIGRSLGR